MCITDCDIPSGFLYQDETVSVNHINCESGVETLAKHAFYHLTNIETVNVANTLQTIKECFDKQNCIIKKFYYHDTLANWGGTIDIA
jgi:hypothetical protein